MAKAERQILIGAPVQSVYDIITHYERYPDFLPEIRSARVISRYEGVSIVKFELDLIMRVTYTLRLAEYRPNRVVWSLEEAKLLLVNDGSWTLEDTRADTGQLQTRATYSLDVVLGGMIPGSVSRRLLGPTLDETLSRFKARAESNVTQRIELVR